VANIGGGMRFVGVKPITSGLEFKDNVGHLGGNDNVDF